MGQYRNILANFYNFTKPIIAGMSTLLFVYNADSGISNALLDAGRRVFKPKQYACALCMVTYGPFGKKNEWKKFISKLQYPVSFLHKDELPQHLLTMNLDFPCLLMLDNTEIKVLINTVEFVKIKSLAALQKKVIEVLQDY